MLVTNTTTQDYYFGPLHLAGGVGQTLTVDDTTATSLYLADDEVADALNDLYNAGKITVSSQAVPFPRPTGTPELLHGAGSPEGKVYAPQGSAYLRRDLVKGLYLKTTGRTLNTGWTLSSPGIADLRLAGLGLIAESVPKEAVGTATPGAGTLEVSSVGLAAGTVITNIVYDCETAGVGTAPTLVRFGIVDAVSKKVLAVSADVHASYATATGPQAVALSAPYTIPADGIYYLTMIRVGSFGTTGEALGAVTAGANAYKAVGSNPLRWGYIASQTDLPAVGVALGALTGSGVNFYLAAN
jgi:hypothetical protein